MSKKIKVTKRKFYNKWLYKVSFLMKGVSYLRIYNYETLDKKDVDPIVRSLSYELSLIDKKSYAQRVERNTIDIYTNDEKLFNYLFNKFQSNVKSAFEPGKNQDSLDQQQHVITANKFAHDRYQYKVFLQPHKLANAEEKINFISWLSSQKDRVKISESVKQWFYKTNWNWDRRYMYVEDEQTLLLIKLKNPQAIGTVYTFVISDK